MKLFSTDGHITYQTIFFAIGEGKPLKLLFSFYVYFKKKLSFFLSIDTLVTKQSHLSNAQKRSVKFAFEDTNKTQFNIS